MRQGVTALRQEVLQVCAYRIRSGGGKPFNHASVIASPTQEDEAILHYHCKLIFFNPFRVVPRGGLSAMGYDFVSPMVI